MVVTQGRAIAATMQTRLGLFLMRRSPVELPSYYVQTLRVEPPSKQKGVPAEANTPFGVRSSELLVGVEEERAHVGRGAEVQGEVVGVTRLRVGEEVFMHGESHREPACEEMLDT